jgi:hypothetical protein
MSAYDYIVGADNVNMSAGGTSFLGGISDAVTKGAPAAILSGLYGFANTGIDLSNKLFRTSADRLDVAETLYKVDRNWGDYYAENKDAIDTVGFVAASIVPGTLAVKGLKLLQTGNVAGAFGRALGYTTRMETHYLNKALTDLATNGGNVFTRVNSAKMASLAFGVADNVLQTAAFEVAAAASLSSSPILENKDWKDVVADMTTNALVGGLIGGGISGLVSSRILKDAGKAVEAKQRVYDRLGSLAGLGVAKGDEAYSLADAVLSLPKEALSTTVELSHGRKDLLQSLDVSKLMDKTLRTSVERGVQKFENYLTNIVKDDPSVGQPFSKALVAHLQQGLKEGVGDDEIRNKLMDVLGNLRRVEAIGDRPLDVSGELRYLASAQQIQTSEGGLRNVFTAVPHANGVKQQVYRVVGDESQVTLAVLGRDARNAEAAFKAGFDTVLDPTTKRISVSPFSKIYQHIDAAEAEFSPMFFNVSTMQASFDAVPTIADVATAKNGVAGGLIINRHGVASGSKSFAFEVGKYKTPADSIEATARHAWAKELPKIFGEVDINDIAVLDALREAPLKAGDGLVLRDSATGIVTEFNAIADFDTFVFKQKIKQLPKLLEAAGDKTDFRDIAYRLNVSGAWVQDAVENGMTADKLYNTAGWRMSQERFLSRDNLLLRYDTSAVQAAEAFPDGILAYHSRVKEAKERAVEAARVVLSPKFHDRLLELGDDLTLTATSAPSGATGFGASNADYTDKLKAWAQYTGQQVANETTDRVSAQISRLQGPAASVLQDADAAAEVSALFTRLRTDPSALSLYQHPATGKYFVVDMDSFKKVVSGKQSGFATQIPLSDTAGAFVSEFHSQQTGRITSRKLLASAQGTELHWDTDKLYAPPIDTQRVPFFAFVKRHDGAVFGNSDVAMITARDAAELQQLVGAIEKDETLKVIYKKGTEDWFKAKATYEFSRTMNEPVLNDLLKSKHRLGNYLPNMTPQAVIEDVIQYTQRAESLIVRDAIEVNYAQTIAELRELSSRYSQVQTSKFAGIGARQLRNVVDPFDDTIKTALNITKEGEFTLWHRANEFVDAMGTAAWRAVSPAIMDAKDGKISWEQANKTLEKFGLGAHFRDEDAFLVAQTAPDRNLIKTALNKANMLLANGMLRLDFANSLLNIVSTPILLSTEVSAIRNSFKNDPELLKILTGMTSEAVPGTAVRVPSAKRLVYNAINNLFHDAQGSKELMTRYKAIGTVRGQTAMYHEMLNDLSLVPNLVPSEFAKKVDKWVEVGAKLTFNEQAEDFTRFVTSDVMRQLTDPAVKAGRMSVQEQNMFMTIFTNRVQGNYVAAQRPIMFQGTIGSAIGLFQTYQFNMFQQLFRHIGNKDLKTLAVAAGMQGTLFGANGLPMFSAINTHLIGNANSNSGHKDAYTFATQAAGKEIGDWMMYGTVSAFPLWSDKAPALWTRGDLNPRSMFIVPVPPMEVPAVQASLKLVNSVLGMAKQVSQGSDMSSALLFGLEHNGINRPLAGLAQVIKGTVTTNKGNLISANQDLLSIATASRLLGAKPMDESIAVTEMYRGAAYAAATKERIDSLAVTVKEKLRNNQSLTEEDWIELEGRYAAAGGRIQNFTQAVRRWDKNANTSVVNEVMKHSQTAAGQRMIEIMGGDPLEDFNP